jgi:gamma-glutamyltranspeptidase/glutathione hydrolase
MEMAHETFATQFGLRPIVYGRRGMVATANPLASLAGVRMLAQGGNAVDAVVAAAAAIAVVEPYMSGLAGCGALLLTRANEQPRALVFFGRAPRMATLDRFGDAPPDVGYLATAVPGNLAGWARVLQDYGTMSLERVLEPAIEYAEKGIPFTPFDRMIFTEFSPRLTPEGTATYLPSGQIPDGGTLTQFHLATTLQQIAKHGVGYLYDGPLGQSIERWMEAHGGLLRLSDLRTYPETLQWEDSIQTAYRGITVYAPPPPSSAVQILVTLNLLSQFDIGHTAHLGPEHIAMIAETSRAARMDTDQHVADPAFRRVPIEHLLSSAHTRDLLRQVSSRVEASHTAGPHPAGQADVGLTTHLAAADASGLAVNISQSLGNPFGSGVVVPQTGVCLNDCMHWFSVAPGHPNVVEPGKTHDFPVAPLHLFRDGQFWGTLGTPGSYGILVTTIQVLVNLIDFGLNLQDAIAAPRFRWADDVEDRLPARILRMESRIPSTTREVLEAQGYEIEMLGPWTLRVGGVQGILMDRATGWIAGAGDPRRNSYAIGW